MIDLQPLFSVTGTATIEALGRVQDGERIKIDTRGTQSPGSPIAGKARATDWVLVGRTGPGETNSVYEITTADRQRLVIELRGYALSDPGKRMEVRSCGIIRTAAPDFSHLNGRVAVVVERIDENRHVEVAAYHL